MRLKPAETPIGPGARSRGRGAGFCLAAALLAAAPGCASRTPAETALSSRPAPARPGEADLIGEVQEFSEALGSHATGNFLRHSDRDTADNRCYFTGKLQLPASYSGLQMVTADEAQCAARAGDYDVFYYPVEAVASGEQTVTASLAEAPIERVLVVVPHEDFHNQREAREAPAEVAEAAATLVGFLTAQAFALEKLGAESSTFRALAPEADLFRRKALIVNSYYNQLSALYRSYRSGALTAAQALERKARLFAELEKSCSEISPDPATFNKCPASMNNAGLAFDRTYTRDYALVHDLYLLLDRDIARLVARLKRLLADWPAAASEAADLLGPRPSHPSPR